MVIVVVVAFFVVVYLLASITVTVAWMAFMKTKAEESAAENRDRQLPENPEDAGQPTVGRAVPDESTLFRDERLSSFNFWDTLLARFDFIEILRARIVQAEMEWSVGRVTSMMLLLATTSLAITVKLLPPLGALAASCAAAYAPYGYVLYRRNKRFLKFRENFPDALDSLARALRAGYPLSAAMEMVASETLPPVSAEIRKTSAEANLGMGWPQALENLGRRMPLLEVNLFTSAVALHARTGGKLSEVLGGLAENMREGLALQGEVRSLAAHGRLTGVILTILPIGIAVMMMVVSPTYMLVLINHPWGKDLIAAAVMCLVLAHVVIGKIVEIKV
jgi:tight adherence protein B